MTINFKKTQFLQSLFPGIDITNDQDLKQAIVDFYSPLVPEIKLDEDFVTVILPEKASTEISNEFYMATDLCTKGQYLKAIPILENLISQNPTQSEYYRNLAQAHEELGDY